MILGDNVLVKVGGKIVAFQKSCKLSLTVEMNEVVALPGSVDDDGWAHYERGQTSWQVSNDSFLSVGDVSMSMGLVGDEATVEMSVGSRKIEGEAVVNQVKMTAQYKTHATVSMSLMGEDFLRLI